MHEYNEFNALYGQLARLIFVKILYKKCHAATRQIRILNYIREYVSIISG